MRACFLLLAAALASVACSHSTAPAPERDPALHPGPGEEVVFRPQRLEYRQGDTAVIVLANHTSQPLGYNLCHSARELSTASGWRRFDPLRICTAVLLVLDPGGETTLREPVTAEWQPGEYRMVTTVELMRSGAQGEIFTPPFVVRR